MDLKAWTYMFGESKISGNTYKAIFCFFVVVGSSLSLGQVFALGDIMIFAMCFPNVLGLYFLAPEIKKDLTDYMRRVKERGDQALQVILFSILGRMKRFKESVKEYFSFTRNERLGAIWLLVLCTCGLLLLAIVFKDYLHSRPSRSDLEIEYIPIFRKGWNRWKQRPSNHR